MIQYILASLFIAHSFRLQVSIHFCCIEARTGFLRVEVAMTDDQGAGVALVEILEQLSHGSLLRSRARVVGLTAGIKSPL